MFASGRQVWLDQSKAVQAGGGGAGGSPQFLRPLQVTAGHCRPLLTLAIPHLPPPQSTQQ